MKYKSWRTVVTNFRQSFPDSPQPSKAMIYNYLVKKFLTTGSVLDKKRTYVKGVLTEEMLDEIGHRLERSPTKSSRRIAQQVEVSLSSVIRGTKLLKLEPFLRTNCGEMLDMSSGDVQPSR